RLGSSAAHRDAIVSAQLALTVLCSRAWRTHFRPRDAAELAQLALPVLRSRAWKTHFRPRDERRGEACQEICKGSRLLSSQRDKPAGKLSWTVPSARK